MADSRTKLFELINEENNPPVPLGDANVTLSAPSVDVQGTHNTEVTVTAKDGLAYSGQKDLTYRRLDVNVLAGTLLAPGEVTTPQELIDWVHANTNAWLSLDDLEPFLIPDTSAMNEGDFLDITLVAKPASLGWYGSTVVSIFKPITTVMWSPKQLDPQMFIDHTSTVEVVNGKVQSILGNDDYGSYFGQTTESLRPTLLTAEVGGKRAMRFTEAQYLEATGSQIGKNLTGTYVFYVAKLRTKSSGKGTVLGVNALGSTPFPRINCGYGAPQAQSLYQSSGRRDSGDSETTTYEFVTPGSWGMVGSYFGFVDNKLELKLNASVLKTFPDAWGAGNAGYYSGDGSTGLPSRIGASPQGGDFLNGDIAAIVVLDGTPSAADIARLEGWAAWNYDLVSLLPNGHPYKLAAPLPEDYWTPAEIAPDLWFDDESNITEVSGKAAVLTDRQNSGVAFTQDTDAYRPLLVSNMLAGRRGLRFDGASTFLRRTMPSYMANKRAGEVFAVYKRRTADRRYMRLFSVMHDNPQDGYTRFGAFINAPTGENSPWLQAEGVGGGAEVNLMPSAAEDLSSWGMTFYQRNFAAGEAAVWHDGRLIAQVTELEKANSTNIDNTRDVYIGSSQKTFAQSADMDLVCLISTQDSVISDADRQRLEGWAAWRYNLVDLLPANHPYKNNRPVKSPAAWSPKQLASTVWLDDKSDAPNSQGLTISWANRGTGGTVFEKSNGVQRPSKQNASLNGLRVQSFDGVNDNLTASGGGLKSLFAAAKYGWMFALVRKKAVDSSSSTNRIIIGNDGSTAGQPRLNFGLLGNCPYLYSVRDSGTSDTLLSTNALDTNWHLLFAEVNWQTGAAKVYLEDELIAETETWGGGAGVAFSGAAAANPASIGAYMTNVVNFPADVEIAAVLQDNGVLTSLDRNLLHGWAAWRYGVTNRLPADHPYKSVAPVLTPYVRQWAKTGMANTLSYGSFSVSAYNRIHNARLRLEGSVIPEGVHLQMVDAPAVQDFEAFFSVVIPTGTEAFPYAPNGGILYRTTSWVNTNDTFGYVLSLAQSGVTFGRGSNGASAGYANIVDVPHANAPGSVVRVRVLVKGNRHRVWLDDEVLPVLDVIDSTYPNAGGMGFNRYTPAGTQTYFDIGDFKLYDLTSIPEATVLAWKTDRNPSGVAFSNSDKTAQYSANYSNTLGTMGKSKGKWAFEFVIGTNTPNFMVGLAKSDYPATNFPGEVAGSVAYQLTGIIRNGGDAGGNGTIAGQATRAGEVITFACDFDNHVVTVYRNGVSMGTLVINLVTRKWFPTAGIGSASGSTVTLRGTGLAFPVEGYTAWEEKFPYVKQMVAARTNPKTKFLLHFDGANNSTTFIDAMGRPVTVGGAAKLSSTNPLFGTTGADFGSNAGGANYVEIADEVELRPLTGAFWFETDWVFTPGPDEWNTLFQKGNWNTYGGVTLIFTASLVKACLNASDSGAFGHGMTAGQRYRIAFGRDADGWVSLFIGGNKIFNYYNNTNLDNTFPIQLMKGGGIVGGASGLLDEARYGVGDMPYTVSYLPQTQTFLDVGPSAFTPTGTPRMLYHFDGTSISSVVDEFGNMYAELTTGLAIATDKKRFGTGALAGFNANQRMRWTLPAITGEFHLSIRAYIVPGYTGDQAFFTFDSMGLMVYRKNADSLAAFYTGDSTDKLLKTNLFLTEGWYMIALERVGTTVSLSVQGTVLGTWTDNRNFGGNNLLLGCWMDGTKTLSPTTRIDEVFLRISGTEYGGLSFVVPQTPFTYAPAAFVPDGVPYVLMHMDGANGATDFTDEMGRAITVAGGVKKKTDFSTFGSASAGDFATNSNLSFAYPALTGDFHISCRARVSTGQTGIQTFFALTGGTGFQIYRIAASGMLSLWAGADRITAAAAVPGTANYMVTLERKSGWIYLSVDGQLVGRPYAYSTTIPAGTLFVGTYGDGASALAADARMDEVFMRVGGTQFGGRNFTPPALAFNYVKEISYTDTFDDPATLSKFTQTSDTALVGWTITGGALKATGTWTNHQSVQTYNTIEFLDGEIETVLTIAEDAGLVIRFIDNANYYLLTIKDATSTTGGIPNTVTLWRKISGAFSQLAQVNLPASFVRGVAHTFKLRVDGSLIRFYYDGNQIGEARDATHAVKSKAGLRSSDSKFSFESVAIRTKVGLPASSESNDFTSSDLTKYFSVGDNWGQNYQVKWGGLTDNGSGITNPVMVFEEEYGDGYIEAVISSSDVARLVVRFQSPKTYYGLQITDESSSVLQPSRMYLYCQNDATYSDIANAVPLGFKWERGIPIRVRFETTGSVLRVYVNGIKVGGDYTNTTLPNTGRKGIGGKGYFDSIGINTPAPADTGNAYADGFDDAATLPAYIESHNGAFSAGVWSMATSGLSAAVAKGAQSLLLYNRAAYIDCYVMAQISKAEDAGLVARYQDNNNYYLATVTDTSASQVTLPNNYARLYKSVGGSYTLLGEAALSPNFPRDTTRTLALMCQGGLLRVSYQGNTVIEAYDTSFPQLGLSGVRANDAPMRAESLNLARVVPQRAYYSDFSTIPNVFKKYELGSGSTWGVANGQLIAYGPGINQSVYIHNDTIFKDGYVEAELTRAIDAGLVLHFWDVNRYLLMTINDASATSGNGTCSIYYNLNGFVALVDQVQLPMPFVRDENNVFRFAANGNSLTASMNGTQIAQVSTGRILDKGRAGLRHYGGGATSIFESVGINTPVTPVAKRVIPGGNRNTAPANVATMSAQTPDGASAGDLLLCWVMSRNGLNVPAEAGWTFVDIAAHTVINTTRQYVSLYTHVVQEGEEAQSFTFSTTTGTAPMMISMNVVKKVGGGTPAIIKTVRLHNYTRPTPSYVLTVPTVESTGAGQVLYTAATRGAASGNDWTFGNGIVQTSVASQTNNRMAVGYYKYSGANQFSTGTLTAASNDGSGTISMLSVLIATDPAPAATPLLFDTDNTSSFMTLYQGNQIARANRNNLGIARSAHPRNFGTWYVEFTILDIGLSDNVVVGFATASQGNMGPGVDSSTPAKGFGMRANGKLWVGGVETQLGPQVYVWNTGDVVGIKLELYERDMYFEYIVNGVSVIGRQLLGEGNSRALYGSLYPAVGGGSSGDDWKIQINQTPKFPLAGARYWTESPVSQNLIYDQSRVVANVVYNSEGQAAVFNGSYQNQLGIIGKSSGLWAFEVDLMNYAASSAMVGIAKSDYPLSNFPGEVAGCAAYQLDGTYRIGPSAGTVGSGNQIITMADTLTMAVNLNTGVVKMFKNGRFAGTLVTALPAGTWFPCIGIGSATGARLRLRGKELKYLPAGFSEWGESTAVTTPVRWEPRSNFNLAHLTNMNRSFTSDTQDAVVGGDAVVREDGRYYYELYLDYAAQVNHTFGVVKADANAVNETTAFLFNSQVNSDTGEFPSTASGLGCGSATYNIQNGFAGTGASLGIELIIASGQCTLKVYVDSGLVFTTPNSWPVGEGLCPFGSIPNGGGSLVSFPQTQVYKPAGASAWVNSRVRTLWTPDNLSEPHVRISADDPEHAQSGLTINSVRVRGGMVTSGFASYQVANEKMMRFYKAPNTALKSLQRSGGFGQDGVNYSGIITLTSANAGTWKNLTSGARSGVMFIVGSDDIPKAVGGWNDIHGAINGGDPGYARMYLARGDTKAGDVQFGGRANDADTFTYTRTANAYSGWNLMEGRASPALGSQEIWINGQLLKTDVFPTNANKAFQTTDNASMQFGGQADGARASYGEWVYIRGTPSASDMARLQGWAAWKWGLAYLLPNNHPYKRNPPYLDN